MRAALVLVAITAQLAAAGRSRSVLDLNGSMSIDEVKASGVCIAAKLDGQYLRCRPITYAGRKMALDIQVYADKLMRVELTLTLGTTRKNAETVLASILPTLTRDFGPLEIAGKPVVAATVLERLEQGKSTMFRSDNEKPVDHRFLATSLDRSSNGAYELSLAMYRDLP